MADRGSTLSPQNNKRFITPKRPAKGDRQRITQRTSIYFTPIPIGTRSQISRHWTRLPTGSSIRRSGTFGEAFHNMRAPGSTLITSAETAC